MSVIQRIQEKQRWVFGSIALALSIFVIQEYFAKNGNSSRPTTIGSVNGTDIEYADFADEAAMIKQINGQREIDQDELNSYVWDLQVNRSIGNQEYNKLGLAYTNKEFGEAVGSNTPPENIRNQFGDRQSGSYNPAMAENYLGQVNSLIKKTPNADQAKMAYYSIIKTTIEQELAKKYQSLISGAVYVPKWLVEKENADNSSVANISYVDVPYSTIADSTVKVTDDDINDYLKRHKKQYEQKEETRQVSYVSFSAVPSHEDSTSVVNALNEVKEEFRTTADVKSFLQSKETGLPYYDGYISKSAIKQPNKDTLFKMQVGEVFGPYLDANNYVLARLVGEKQWPDSVKVRHILVATQQQDQTTGQFQRIVDDSVATKRLDSAIAEIKAGKSWDSVCLKYSDDPGSKSKGGVYNFFAANGQMAEQFNDFAFDGKKGETKTVHTVYGFHYIEILDQKGSQPAYKYAYLGKPITESQTTDDSVRNEAVKFASTVQSHSMKEFYDNATKIKAIPQVVPGILENAYSIGNPGYPGSLGKGRSFIKWVYQADLGDISEPTKFGDKYIVAILTGINKPGLPSAESARPQVEQKIRNEKKAKIIIAKIKGTTLEAIAQSTATQVQQADSVYFQSKGKFGSVISSEPSVTGAAFNKQLQGKVSQPIAGESGVFIVKDNSVTGVASLAEGGIDQQRKAQEYQLKSEEYQLQQQSQTAAGPLRKAAKVKDYRSKFF